MDYDEDSSPKLSKYNSAIAQLYRLDSLWQDTHLHCREGNLMKWNWDLDRVWCELAADTKQETKDKFDEINLEIAKNKNHPSKLYLELLKKEIFLRELQNKQGKGTAYQDEDEDMFE